MRSRIWAPFAVLMLVVACGSDDDEGGGKGGSGGKGGTDGGKGGSGGTSASGGSGGTGAGGTGAGGTGAGGTGAGGATGGTAGASGGAAGNGRAGQGGSAGQIVKDVPCDGVTACPVQPGQCCYAASAATDGGTGDAGGDAATSNGAICQGDNGQCTSGVTIRCNDGDDCNGINICCLKITVATGVGTASCVKPGDCEGTTGPDGGVTVRAAQLCDPAQTTPTECVSGACQAYSGAGLPSGYNACQ